MGVNVKVGGRPRFSTPLCNCFVQPLISQGLRKMPRGPANPNVRSISEDPDDQSLSFTSAMG
jgi:hypothetical protein